MREEYKGENDKEIDGERSYFIGMLISFQVMKEALYRLHDGLPLLILNVS